VGSIFGEPVHLAMMAHMMDGFDLVGLEINASCPNTQDDSLLENSQLLIDSCRAVKKVSRHPILLKLSVAHEFEKIAPAVEDVVEAFSVNSVPWRIIFPNRKSPLEKFGGGGVSGKIAQPLTWPFAERLQKITRVPVIAPSVWDFEDLSILRRMGFKAFSFGSVFLRYPWRPTPYVRKETQNRR
jgi:dihydroorotate dehydrogenase